MSNTTSPYHDFFRHALKKIIDENRYRDFLNISRIAGKFPMAINHKDGKEITIWCSNDYLGLGQLPESINNVIEIVRKYGTSAGGTRNISGNHNILVELENAVSKLHNKESSLVFTSGYVANQSTIETLCKIIPNLVIFSDQKNHASIIHGIKSGKVNKHIFNHNDVNNLEKYLKSYDLNQPKLIIFESVYSMDGSIGKIEKIVELSKKYKALTYIDEVHAVGLYGKYGGGISQELNIEDKIDIIQGTFGKAFASLGGYISSSKTIIDTIKSYASGFIFTTALPPMVSATSLHNVLYCRNNNKERNLLKQNVKFLKGEFKKHGIKIIPNNSHIIAIMINNPKLAKEISNILLEEYKIYVQHINYPTVAKGEERLRITVSPFHSKNMMNKLVSSLKELLTRFSLI